MRQVFNLNQGWIFSRDVPEDMAAPLENYLEINLPYTWSTRNAQGFKGKCIYRKELPVPAELRAIRLFLEFKGVSNVCLVYVNDTCVGIHKGGFTAFCMEITKAVVFGKTNIISIVADNSDYSAMCHLLPDAEFFGGVWGDVNLIIAGVTHFALDDHGSDGVYINTKVDGSVGRVAIHAVISNPVNYDIVSFTVYDAAGERINAAAAPPKDANVKFEIENPSLWKPGMDNAYLYKLRVKLLRDGEILDERDLTFGFRRLEASPEKGLLVNGKKTPIKGVIWGQDADAPKQELKKDLDTIRAMGANAIRLLNYYQTESFFELCDRYGMMLWCELPLNLDSVNEDSKENLMEQYTELIKQVYNHPSVCFIAADGGATAEGRRAEEEVHKLIQSFNCNVLSVSPDFIHYADKKATIADVCGIKFSASDLQSGDFAALPDAFHVNEKIHGILISEYGTAGDIRYHSASPQNGDFSEEYQALYHETAADLLLRRDFIAGGFIAELYDAAEFKGGLICADYETKKDAYWFYKSQWSDDKFVKIASSRFKNRTEKRISIKVYSNCRTVNLTVNGKLQKGGVLVGGVFLFEEVRLNRGNNEILAQTEEGCSDKILLHKKKNEDPSYVFHQEV